MPRPDETNWEGIAIAAGAVFAAFIVAITMMVF